MPSPCKISCVVFALLLAVGFKPFASWAVPRLLWRDAQPPAGTQAPWVHKVQPDWGGSLVRNLPTNFCMTDRRMDFLEQNFSHNSKDVWVISYQKTGTTWTQYIASQILGHAKVNGLFELFERCPWPEVDVGILSTPTDVLQNSAGVGKPQRCFKSHWPRTDFFAKLPTSSKVVYIFREVENVVISYWHHIHNAYFAYWLRPGDISWDTYFEKFITGDVENGDYFEHVASWWKIRKETQVLFLRYKDLKRDTPGTIRRMAEFMEAPVDEARVAEIVEGTSLRSMKKWNEGLLDSFLIWTGAMRGEHVRSGGAGAKETLVTDAQRERLIERYNAVLKPIGVPFEDMFKSNYSSSSLSSKGDRGLSKL